MKKLIIGLVAIGVVLAVRPLVKRKAAQKMREHCSQMVAKRKEKMAQFGGGEEAGMPEHCTEMATKGKEKMAQFGAGQEAPESEQPEPTVVGNDDRSEVLTTA
jgi:hypothetical protein